MEQLDKSPEILEKFILDQNPWHDPKNKDWFMKDGALREAMEAERNGLYTPPKVLFFMKKYFLDEIFANPQKWGVVIVLGPRRVGKTSTFKYWVREKIDPGVSEKSIIYLSLDQDELFIPLEKSRKLREFIGGVIGRYKKPGKPLVIILDEVTFYKGWARSIKNLVDSGDIGPGIGVVATGSYSMDLSSAKRELSGRYGPLGEELKGEVIFHPRRFIEVAESVLGSDFKNLFGRKFGSFGRRTGIIEYLAGIQTEINNIKYNYDKALKQFVDTHYHDLHSLFDNIYMVTGGYPRAIYEAIMSQRNGKRIVSDARYRDDIYTLFVTDSIKFGLSEKELKDILLKIDLPSLQVPHDFSTFSHLKKEDTKRYKEYLEVSGLFSFLPNISPKDIDLKSRAVRAGTDTMKMVVNDPAAFLSIYLCSRGVTSEMLGHAIKVLRENQVREHLSESIVLSHLKHIPMIQISNPDNVGYISFREDGREVADGFCWYINRKNELCLIAMESKCAKNKLNLRDIENRASWAKEKFNVKRLIVVTNLKHLEITEKYSILPIEIFLSLL